MRHLDKESYGIFNEIGTAINAVVTPLDLDANLDAQAYERATFEAATHVLAAHAGEIPEPVLEALLDWSLESGGPGPGITRALIDIGARVGDDVYVFDPDLKEPAPILHVAAGTANRADPRQLIRRLVEAGADVNLVNDTGATPLHIAAGCRDGAGVVATLIDLGADLDARDAYGGTPLHVAARGSSPNSVVCLLEAGADTSIWDLQGRMAQDIAADRVAQEAQAIRDVFQSHARRKAVEHVLDDTQDTSLPGPSI